MRTCNVEMSDGTVACPYLFGGTIGVEACYRCPRLRAMHERESGTTVICAVPWGFFGKMLHPRPGSERQPRA